jgi:hypothetical protein
MESTPHCVCLITKAFSVLVILERVVDTLANTGVKGPVGKTLFVSSWEELSNRFWKKTIQNLLMEDSQGMEQDGQRIHMQRFNVGVLHPYGQKAMDPVLNKYQSMEGKNR